MLNEIIDSYQWGWNLTRAALAGKRTYGVKTCFGDILVRPDVDTRRAMEAERLYHKYTKMLLRKEKENYCEGALALIKEWDIIGVCPGEITDDYEDDEEDYYDDD